MPCLKSYLCAHSSLVFSFVFDNRATLCASTVLWRNRPSSKLLEIRCRALLVADSNNCGSWHDAKLHQRSQALVGLHTHRNAIMSYYFKRPLHDTHLHKRFVRWTQKPPTETTIRKNTFLGTFLSLTSVSPQGVHFCICDFMSYTTLSVVIDTSPKAVNKGFLWSGLFLYLQVWTVLSMTIAETIR